MNPEAVECETFAGAQHCHVWRPFLVLFTESLGVGFTVRIEEFLAALLPRHLEPLTGE